MKFYNSEFNLSAEESKKIRLKKELFKHATHTKKKIIITYITTYGLIQKDKMGSVDKELGMEIFFECKISGTAKA
jgi:hypothetical protein